MKLRRSARLDRHHLALSSALAGASVAPALHAHGVGAPPTLATAWTVSFAYLLLPFAALVLYAVGQVRLWRRAGFGRGVSFARAATFWSGAAVLFLCIVWPLDAYGEWSLAAHMAQHMLLLAVAPPLLLAGQPMAVYAHVLPQGWTRVLSLARLRYPVRFLAAATLAQAAIMLLWHAPAAIALALDSDIVHVAMHASFLLAGLWFWAALLRTVRELHIGVGAGLLALLAAMMQMGLLGALLTFSPRVLYPTYAERAPGIGLDALADQQLAGILMWVPACFPYLVGALWLMSGALRRNA